MLRVPAAPLRCVSRWTARTTSSNAAAAVAAAELAGVDPRDAAEALATFRGVHRRFELRGRIRGATFFDDYGHTPTEMAVTIDVAPAAVARAD